MLEVEINGQKLNVPDGSTVIEAARLAGTYIPHFCYHKKLSIAANCRMCLVDVEKAPKPLPACATPVTDGMIVRTASESAKNAQKGVMEFLLINHPLDCPICDQGGECQLQDLAVGYGKSGSRYQEQKRVVSQKDLGPLITTDMTRCIHCTRCVRFTEEIGGEQELGMAHRGEHSEILSFIGRTVDSEISGNVIDLCPVGALTSKPFRYSARTWELSRRRSIAPHDGLGSHLVVQVKNDRVMRVLPLEEESINECWLSDRDRFSYEGLLHEERLSHPMIKQDGLWHKVSWDTALEYVVASMRRIIDDHGVDAVGVLANSNRTCEELFLLNQLTQSLGLNNIDSRLRRSDFRDHGRALPWLGQSIEDFSKADAFFIIGGSLRKELPLLAHRIRQAVKKGAALSVLEGHATFSWLAKVQAHQVASPVDWVDILKDVLHQGDLHPLVKPLIGKSPVIVLSYAAQCHPDFTVLWALAQKLADQLKGSVAIPSASANEVGAYALNVRPKHLGLNAEVMMDQPRKAYWLFGCEPEWDMNNGYQAVSSLNQAKTVCAFTSYASDLMKSYCDVLLPIAPFSETAGTFINMEGRIQSFNGVVKPWQETRPAWRVLRVLGNLFGLSGFEYQDISEVRSSMLSGEALKENLSYVIDTSSMVLEASWRVNSNDLARFGEVPLYELDGLCRRSQSLQATKDGSMDFISLSPNTAKRLGFHEGECVKVIQEACSLSATLNINPNIPDNVVLWPMNHRLGLSPRLFGTVQVQKEV